ncbi:MAG: hypothetical protein ACON35_01600 [Candidatus Marinamargulisbacteria bacterium]
MTELNKTEPNQNQIQQKKTPAAPAAQSIKQFNHLFNKAANTVRKAEEKPNDTLKKNPIHTQEQSAITQQTHQKEFIFENEQQFSHIFNEMGIQNIQQIQQIILTVSQKIIETTQIPQGTLSTAINVITKDHQLKINIDQPIDGDFEVSIECDESLKNLLTQVLPELKTHLKKQGFDVTNINLSLLTNPA